MRAFAFILFLCPWLASAAPAGLNLSSTTYTACFLKPMMSAAAYPSGATHYWALADNLNDGVGAFTLVDAEASYTAGKNGQCLVLEASESVTTGANTLPVTTAFSIVQWVYLETGALLDLTIGVAGLSITTGDSTFTATVGSVADSLDGGAIVYDAWHLLIVTYDGSSVEKFSVDGGTFVTGTVTTEGVNGAASWSASDAAVRLDEPATFTRALTQTEVGDIYNGGTGRFGP